MKTLKMAVALFFVLCSLIFVGCKKDDTKEEVAALQDTYTEENESTKMVDAVNKVVEDELDNNADSLGRTAGIYTTKGTFCSCSNVTFNLTNKTVTVDFGTGCLCSDGRTRSGKIIATYTDRYRNPGALITTVTDNHYVNDVKIEMKKIVKNITVAGGKPTWEVNVQGLNGANAELTFSDGRKITYNSKRTRIKVAGDNTLWTPGSKIADVIKDDVYEIYGKANGVSRAGRSWTAMVESSTPITYKIECWLAGVGSATFSPVQGILKITPQDSDLTTINYGSGTCDRDAVVNFKGKDYNVVLAR